MIEVRALDIRPHPDRAEATIALAELGPDKRLTFGFELAQAVDAWDWDDTFAGLHGFSFNKEDP